MNLYDLDYPQLTELLAGWGYSEYHSGRVWHHLYRQHTTNFDGMSDLRADLLQQFQENAQLHTLTTRLEQKSLDGTYKYLLNLPDGQTIETVLMPYRDRYTACISTQAGCAMGCVFCATGQMGFTRHLTAGEIVAQILFLLTPHAPRPTHPTPDTSHRQLRNIVLMGMGEPLHNYEATMTALDILTHPKGLAIAPRHITISTVGVVPGIIRLADEARPGNLAVSIHAATDEERNKLIPIGRRWPLDELISACRYYGEKRKRRIFFEWTLIQDENDTPNQAHALGQLLTGLDAHVNLIPLNPTQNYMGMASKPNAVKNFQTILASYGLPSTVRQRRGLDIAAGCGQLRERIQNGVG